MLRSSDVWLVKTEEEEEKEDVSLRHRRHRKNEQFDLPFPPLNRRNLKRGI